MYTYMFVLRKDPLSNEHDDVVSVNGNGNFKSVMVRHDSLVDDMMYLFRYSQKTAELMMASVQM